MARITLKNNLEGKDVKVREGNAGVTRELATLKPGKSFVIHNDPNATYREYIIITLPDKTKLRVLTSDDFAEFKEISIFEDGGKYDWMGTVSRTPAPAVEDAGAAQTGPIKRFLHKFGIKL